MEVPTILFFYDFIASWLSEVDSSWQPLSNMGFLAAIIIDLASKTESKSSENRFHHRRMRDLKLFVITIGVETLPVP